MRSFSVPFLTFVFIVLFYHTLPLHAGDVTDNVWCTFTRNTCQWKPDSSKGLYIARLPRAKYSVNSDGPVTLFPSVTRWTRYAYALYIVPLTLMGMTTPVIEKYWGSGSGEKCLQFDYYLFGPYADIQLVHQSVRTKKEYVIWGRSVNALNKDSWSSFRMIVPDDGGYRFKLRASTKEYSSAALANLKATSLSDCKQYIEYCDFDTTWPGEQIQYMCSWLTFQNDSSFGWTRDYRSSVDSKVPVDHSSKDLTGQMLSTTRGKRGTWRPTAKVFFKRNNRYSFCFSFWYYKLSGDTSDEIFAYRTSQANGMSTRLWSNVFQGRKDPVGQWNHVRVSIPAQFLGMTEWIEAGIGVTKKSDDLNSRVFIDSMTLSTGACKQELSCEFSTDTCAYDASPGKYRWSLGRGRVADPAKLGENFTLPISDHDFLYIDSTNSIDIVSNPDKVMKIVSESATARSECVSFDFYKSRIDNKPSTSRDSEVTMKITSTYGEFDQTWYVHAKELNTWNRQLFPIQSTTEFKISILVDSDRLDGTFLAFKDLVVKPGECPDPRLNEDTNGDDDRTPTAPGVYDCNFDEHTYNIIDESTGRYCNWQSTPLQINSFRLGTSSSFKDNQSLPRHDHTTGSKKGRFLIGNINVKGETVPLTLDMKDKSFDGDVCLTFWTFFKPLWNFHPMIVFVNQTAGESFKESQFQVTPSSKWSLFKLDMKQWSGVSNRLELTIKRFRGVVDSMAIDDIEITKGTCASANKKHILDCDFEPRTLTECNENLVLSDGWKIVRDYKDKTFNGQLMGSSANFQFDQCPKETTALTTSSIDISESSCIKFWYRLTRSVSMTSSVVKTIDNEIFDKYSDPAMIATTQGLWLPVVFDNDVFNDWTLSISGSCPNQTVKRYIEPSLSIDEILIMRGKCDLENSLTACDFESDSCLWFSVVKGSFYGDHFLDSNGIWERHPAIEFLINTTSADITFPVTDATGDSDGSYLLLQNAQETITSITKKAIFLSPLFSWPETSDDQLTEDGVTTNPSVTVPPDNVVTMDPSLIANDTASNSSIACLSFYSISNHDQELLVGKLSNLNLVSTPFSNDVNLNTDIWRQHFVQVSREINESRFFHLAFIGMLRHQNNYVAIDNINLRIGETCPILVKDFTCDTDTNVTIDGRKVCDFVKDCDNGSDEANCGYECSFDQTRKGRDYCKWKDIRPTLDSWSFRGDAIVSNFIYSANKDVGLRSPQFKSSISDCNLNITYGASRQFGRYDTGVDFQIFLSVERQEKFMIFSSKASNVNVFPTNAIINIGKVDRAFEIILGVKRDRSYHTVAVNQYHLEQCMKFNATMNSVCGEGESKCANGKCIPAHNVCNMNDDCEDNSDEIGCFDGDKENWSCTFDDVCDFATTTNWRIQKSSLGHPLIGPTRDHTTNSPKGKVLFMKAPVAPGREMSGTIESSDVKSKCFTMFYQSKNSSASTISIGKNSYPLQGVPGNWMKFFVSDLDQKSKLEITATVQPGDWIAVDDFSFGVNCSAESTIVPVSVTTVTPTSTPTPTPTVPAVPTPTTSKPTAGPTPSPKPTDGPVTATIAPPTKAPIVTPPPPAKYFLVNFTCDNKQQIPKLQLCDGVYDCTDGSDETKATCDGVKCTESGQFFCSSYNGRKQCIPQKFYCYGFPKCSDGSGEDDRFCKLASDTSIESGMGSYCGDKGRVDSSNGKFLKCICFEGFSGKRCSEGGVRETTTSTTSVPIVTKSTETPTKKTTVTEPSIVSDDPGITGTNTVTDSTTTPDGSNGGEQQKSPIKGPPSTLIAWGSVLLVVVAVAVSYVVYIKFFKKPSRDQLIVNAENMAEETAEVEL